MDIEDNDGYVPRIVTADGDPLARRQLRGVLHEGGMTVVAEATTGQEAVELATFYTPDIVVLDEDLPVLDGLQTTRAIRERFPNILVVMLSSSPEDEVGLRALRMGACGYLSKEFGPGVLARSLRGVLEGEAAISRRLAMQLVEADRSTPRGGTGMRPVRSPLTDREWEVLDLMASGGGTDDIARTLVLSTETVRSHYKNLYRKLGVRSRQEAVEAAQRLRDRVA